MPQSTTAIIILAAVILMYSLPFIPLSVTTVLAMLAMAMAGILSYADAFSGFSNSAVLLVAGMMVIGRACFTSGLAGKVGRVLYRFVGANEKLFMVMVFLLASVLAIFLNGALIVAMMIPIVDSVAAGYGEMSLFAPTVVNLPALIVVIALYLIFGYDLQKNWFDFEEMPLAAYTAEQAGEEIKPYKMYVTGAVLIGVVAALVLGMNYGAVALLGSAILILSGCVGERDAFRSVSWSSVIIVAGAIGFSKGLDASGAGSVIANFIIELCGPLGQSPFRLCVILFILGSLLSNVMSDNASVAVLIPITISLAQALACDPMPMVLSCASGIKVAVATPMTMIQIPGYRFKDYFRVGGLVNIISMVVTSLVIWMVYFL